MTKTRSSAQQGNGITQTSTNNNKSKKATKVQDSSNGKVKQRQTANSVKAGTVTATEVHYSFHKNEWGFIIYSAKYSILLILAVKKWQEIRW